MFGSKKPVLRWSEPRDYYRALQNIAKQENFKAYAQENIVFPFLLGFFFGWVFAIGANMTSGNVQQLGEHFISSLTYGLIFGLACLGIHNLDRVARPVISFSSKKIKRKTGRAVERFPIAKIDHYAIENRYLDGRHWRCLVLFMPSRLVPLATLVLDDDVDEDRIAQFFNERNIRKTLKITNDEVIAAIEANIQ